MTSQIQEVRMLSARIRRLLKAKQEVGTVLYIDIRGDIFLGDPLKEFLGRLEAKIQSLRSEINDVIVKLPGYDKEKHVSVQYLSLPDLKAGVIDISKDGNGKSILNLEDGTISEHPDRNLPD